MSSDSSSNVLCASIKSKKNPHLRCPNSASKGEWCARHIRTKVHWQGQKHSIFSKKEHAAGKKISSFFYTFVRRSLRRIHGPGLYCIERSQNDKDIYSMDSILTIPFTYHFSYIDSKKLLWVFDLRFLLYSLNYGNELKNPFTQENIPSSVKDRLQCLAERLQKAKQPIVYLESDSLTPEQLWNQKVLDVFLKLHIHGYSANIQWFESLSVPGHELFYKNLYFLWNDSIGLTNTEREKLIPGHMSGRFPVFRWHPRALQGKTYTLKWWRKQTLNLMNTFLTRANEKEMRGCGALYVLTALVQTHPKAAEAFPYLLH
jgi:hypothetical protein